MKKAYTLLMAMLLIVGTSGLVFAQQNESRPQVKHLESGMIRLANVIYAPQFFNLEDVAKDLADRLKNNGANEAYINRLLGATLENNKILEMSQRKLLEASDYFNTGDYSSAKRSFAESIKLYHEFQNKMKPISIQLDILKKRFA